MDSGLFILLLLLTPPARQPRQKRQSSASEVSTNTVGTLEAIIRRLQFGEVMFGDPVVNAVIMTVLVALPLIQVPATLDVTVVVGPTVTEPIDCTVDD